MCAPPPPPGNSQMLKQEIISRRDRAALAETAVGKGRVVPGTGSVNFN